MPGSGGGYVRTVVTWSFVGLLIILCAITIWDVSARNAKYDQRADYYAANHARETESAIQRECVGADLAAIQKCVEEKVRAEQESQRAEYDLAAQQAMSDWALGVLIISFVTLIATVAGVVYVRNTLLETRRIGARQLRAYVSVARVEGSLRTSSTRFDVSILIGLKNSGQTPAQLMGWAVEWHLDGGSGGAGSSNPHYQEIGPGVELTNTYSSGWEISLLYYSSNEGFHFGDLVVTIHFRYKDYLGKEWRKGVEYRSAIRISSRIPRDVDLIFEPIGPVGGHERWDEPEHPATRRAEYFGDPD